MCINVFMMALYNSVMNSESSDHVVDVASWLFGQHMFPIPSVHTHSSSPMSAIRGLLVFVSVCVREWILERGCLSVHLCLWVDGAVGGRLCHVCVPYMSECVGPYHRRARVCQRGRCLAACSHISWSLWDSVGGMCEFGLFPSFWLWHCPLCVSLRTIKHCLCGVPVGDHHPVPPCSGIHYSCAFISNQPSSPSSCVSLSLSPPPPRLSLFLSVGIHVKYMEFWQAKNTFICVRFLFYPHYK